MDAGRRVYFDYNATTPCDPRVIAAMLPFFGTHYGNAASQHWAGREAEQAVALSRQQVASLLGVSAREIIWTSGATESNNIAIKGVAKATQRAARGRHVITQSTEHKAVLDPIMGLQREGFEVTLVPVDRDGVVDPDALRKAVRADTVLVSIMWANNETGTIQELDALVRAAKSVNAETVFHCDATQAVGRIPVDPERVGVDLLSFSAHKLYGPKGCGALYIRKKHLPVAPLPLFDGGGHERGLRPGTLNVPSIVGFGTACHIAAEEMVGEAERLGRMRERLRNRFRAELDDVWVNGSEERCLPNTLNVCLSGASAESVMLACPQIAMSAGSACTSTKVEPSHVLRAMGLNEEQCFSSIRLSLGRGTTFEDVEYVADQIIGAVRAARSLANIF